MPARSAGEGFVYHRGMALALRFGLTFERCLQNALYAAVCVGPTVGRTFR